MSNQGLRGWSRRLRAGAIGALVLSSAVLSLGSVPAFAQPSCDQRECYQQMLDILKKAQAEKVAQKNYAAARQLQPDIDKLQHRLNTMPSLNPDPMAATPRPPAQSTPPVGPPANKSTVTGVVKPPQNMPEPTKPTPVTPPADTPLDRTVREILEPQKNPQPQPQPQQTNPQPQQQAPSPQQATGSAPPAVQKEGGVRVDPRSQGQTEDLNRNDVLKLLRKPGT